jgi:prophage antirepressor-like protein
MSLTTSSIQVIPKIICHLATKIGIPFFRLLGTWGARFRFGHIKLEDHTGATTPTKFIRQALGLRLVEVQGCLLFLLPEVRDALWLSHDQVSDVLTVDQWCTVETTNGLCNTFVDESALYSLAFISGHPTARAFTRWVSGTVLPNVRHQGTFTDNAS